MPTIRSSRPNAFVLNSRPATDSDPETPTYWPEVLIQYTVDGVTYSTWTYDIARTASSDEARVQQALDVFLPGESYACWYDPADPSVAVLVRGYTLSSIWLLALPASFVAVGGAGLAYTLIPTGKSTERRAAIRDASVPERILKTTSQQIRYPTIPDTRPFVDSPGTTLAYRLPVESAEAWSMAALSLLTVRDQSVGRHIGLDIIGQFVCLGGIGLVVCRSCGGVRLGRFGGAVSLGATAVGPLGRGANDDRDFRATFVARRVV